jgi:uncharacterized membrane protein
MEVTEGDAPMHPSTSDFPEPPKEPPTRNLVRYLPYAGVVLVTIGVFTLAIISRADAKLTLALLAAIGTMFYAGKEVGIPVGLAAGADPVLVGTYILIADVSFTCFAYPPLHYAIKTWMERPGLVGAYLRHVRKGADKHRGFVQRHRKWGLFLFMLVPFAINGPLVGAVLGRLLGMRARQIIPTLIAAIATTTLGWTAVYGFGFAVAQRINPVYPKFVAGAIILIVILVGSLSFLRARRAHREEVRAAKPRQSLTP